MKEYHRSLMTNFLSAMNRSHLVLLVGVRQSGKSFLMKGIAKLHLEAVSPFKTEVPCFLERTS